MQGKLSWLGQAQQMKNIHYRLTQYQVKGARTTYLLWQINHNKNNTKNEFLLTAAYSVNYINFIWSINKLPPT